MSSGSRLFSRQTVLEGFGPRAQKRLSKGTALVVGLGGTGCVAATYLALAGVGRLVIVDRDVVSMENLHRQPIYTGAEAGTSKAEAAATYLRRRAPTASVEYMAESLDSGNASSLVQGADVVLDCLDNQQARLALNGACAGLRVPLVHTGSVGWDASVAVVWTPRTACLECLFPGAAEDLPTCETVGALGPIASYAGSMGALEAIRILAGIRSPLLGNVLVYDGRTDQTQTVRIGKRKGCRGCGGIEAAPSLAAVAELCGGNEFFISRALTGRELGKLRDVLDGRATRRGDSVILVTEGGKEFSVFRTGGVLVKGAASSSDALASFRRLFS